MHAESVGDGYLDIYAWAFCSSYIGVALNELAHTMAVKHSALPIPFHVSRSEGLKGLLALGTPLMVAICRFSDPNVRATLARRISLIAYWIPLKVHICEEAFL